VATLTEIIGFLWSRVLPPGWMASYAADGVLHHQGWAVQEMPRNEKKGGYLQAIRDIAPQGGGVTGLGNPAQAFYEKYYRDQQQPLLFPTAEVGTPALEPGSIAEFYDITFHRYFSAELVLVPPDYTDFVDPYGKGTCFIYQSLITSPVSLGANRWEVYQHTEVDEIRRACKLANFPSRSLYFNIGLNNNAQFFDNTLDLKFRYPQKKFVNWFDASDQNIRLTYFPGSVHPATQRDPELAPAYAIHFPVETPLHPDTLIILGALFFFAQLPDPISVGPTFWWPNPALDVTHPVVVRLALDDIRNVARRYGRVGADLLPAANFIIGGEFTVGYGPPILSGNPPNTLRRFQLPILDEGECRNCQPLAPYSAELDVAFREYLKEILGLVDPNGGLDIDAVNARWGLTNTDPFDSEAKVSPSTEDWCKVRIGEAPPPLTGAYYKAVEDYRAFIERLERDLYIIQYVEAKKHAVHGRHGMRGPFNAEQAWLNSDLLLSGEWYHRQIQIEEPLERALYYQASMCRIGGKPAGFPLASPPSTEREGSLEILSKAGKPGYAVPPQEWLEGNPLTGEPRASAAFEPRCITREHFFFLYQDILTAGVFGFGYHRLYGFGVFDSVKRELHDDLGSIRSEDFFGVQTFVDILEQFKGTIQPKYLRFMTPYQRIGVHLDEYQLVDFAEQVADGTVRFAATLLPWLDEHHYTYAMLSDPRVFVRLFSKHLLRASVTISSFHKDLDASLMAQYVDLVAASAGLVIVLTDDAGNARIESAPHGGAQEELYPGSAWKWQPWDDPDPAVARVFVYVIADEGDIGSSGSTNFEDIRAELEEHIAKVAARVVDVQLDSGLPSVKPSDVRTNFVTDGLNYVIALTNVAQGELPDGTATGIATGTLSLAAAVRSAAVPRAPGPGDA
jgi:hypothetical protein